MANNILIRAADGLMNALTGAGGKNDASRGNSYAFTPLTQHQIESAYRGSGLMRKIIDIPALDVVREWREWRGESDDLPEITAEERRLQIPQKVMLAEILRGLGGGAFVLGLPGNPEEAAVPGAKGSLAFIHVVSRWQITAHDWVDDALDPLFGGPRYWTMNSVRGQQKIHPSRVICFKGDPIPSLTTSTAQEDSFWGESRVQRVLDAVTNSDTAQASFASLISKAKLTRVGIPGLMELVGTEAGEANLAKRLSAIATSESIYNHSVYDSGNADGKGGEKMDDVSYTFAGMKDVMDSYGMWVSAISDIPATRLLGKAPEGMNSSGDGQQKDWNKQIRARQTLNTGPCLDQLDKFLVPSAIGSTPPDTWYEFPPLDLPDEKTVAETFKLNMEAATALRDMGAVPDDALNEGVQSLLTEQGYLPALEAALKKVPDAERFGIQQGGPEDDDPSALAVTGAANDAAPRTLYVHRKLLNGGEFLKWAKDQGFGETLDKDDLHVTITYSKTPVDWMKMGQSWGEGGNHIVNEGGARIVEPLGDKGAVVLLFASSELSWRHEDMVRNGASDDFPEYQPHVTITYQGSDIDLDKVEPYRGKLEFGPEIFEELDEDWASKKP